MKKILIYILLGAAVSLSHVACVDIDAINSDLNELDSRISDLEDKCRQMNRDLYDLKDIVSAYENKDYVTSCVGVGNPIDKWIITFKNAGDVVINTGRSGKDGVTPMLKIEDGYWWVSYEEGKEGSWEKLGRATGENGATPALKVEGGYWYVAYSDGVWQPVLDENGAHVKAKGEDGKTPQLEIRNGYWYVSYGDGVWQQVGKAVGDAGFSPQVEIRDGYWWILETEGGEWKNLNVKAEGEDGEDGVTPQLRVHDGFWQVSYTEGQSWEFVYDTDNNKVAATAGSTGSQMPEFKIEGGKWYVSYNGASGPWVELGQATGDKGEQGNTPQLMIDPSGYWCVSYDNGVSWKQVGKAVGEKGDTGAAGDAGTATISTRQEADGKYYWTCNGELIYDNSGQPMAVTAEHVVPQMRVNGNVWQVSHDDGQTWTDLTGWNPGGNHYIFSDVDATDPSKVDITLNNGDSFSLPKYLPVTLTYNGGYISQGDLITIEYSALNASSVNVVVKDEDVNASFVNPVNSNSGTISIETSSTVLLSKQEVFIIINEDWWWVTFNDNGKVVITDIR